MNIAFSAEHEAFRDEVRRFLDAALTDELRDAQRRCPGIFLDYEHNIVWHRILHRQGWVAPAWPVEHGGTGWDLARRYLWTRECALAGAPSLAPMGLGMCGPMLIGFGTEAQKAHYLPGILSGEDYWCQGYSEPGAGSDLASLALRAVSDGDHYVLNGTKIWTTHAHVANRMFCLVRTRDGGKPQEGITFLLLDMDTAGITVEPILFASGTHEVNQVFFDDVRVPKANRVGQEHQGWTVAKYLLEFERGGGGMAAQQVALDRVHRLASAIPVNGRSLADDSAFRRRLDALAVGVRAAELTELRIMSALSRGRNPGPESSLMKNLGAELSQRISTLMLEAVGHDSLTPPQQHPTHGAQSAAVSGEMAFTRHFNLRASSIAGGTNEVQKNIIAKLVLGL